MSTGCSDYLRGLFDGVDSDLQCVRGEINGESVFAMILKLSGPRNLEVTEDSSIESSWNWSYADDEVEPGLTLNVELVVDTRWARSDLYRFRVNQSEEMAMLNCLMRQNCLPLILLSDCYTELAKVSFEWTAEDRAQIASLTATVLANTYQRRDLQLDVGEQRATGWSLSGSSRRGSKPLWRRHGLNIASSTPLDGGLGSE